MIGFRGASRYYSPRYREGFALECRAIRSCARRWASATSIVMIPFCRSIAGGRPRARGDGRERPRSAARTASRSTSCARSRRT